MKRLRLSTLIPLTLGILSAAMLFSSCGNGTETPEEPFVTPIAAPKNVKAAVKNTTTIVVTWDAVEEAVSYEVQRTFSGETDNYNASQNSYTDAQPGEGANAYVVRAVDADGEKSEWSSSASCTYTPDDPGPGPSSLDAPTNLTIKKENNTITVTWDAVEGATHYYFYRSTAEDGEYTLIPGAKWDYTKNLFATDAAPKAGMNYYKVTASDDETGESQSEFSAVISYKYSSNDFNYDDVITAYDAFNEKLFHPTRKMYRSNTNSGNGLAVNWTQAMYFDMIINAYKLTGDDKYLTLMNDMLVGCEDLGYCTWEWYRYSMWDLYDDMMWWVGSLARAYLFVKDLPANKQTGKLNPTKLLADAVAGFDRVWYGNPNGKKNTYSTNGSSADYYDTFGSYAGDDPETMVIDLKGGGTRTVKWNDGGMYWDYKFERYYKPSCINWPTVIAAMELHKALPNATDPVFAAARGISGGSYLDKAKDVYEWSRNNLFSNGRIANGKHGGENGGGGFEFSDLIYNQATAIGSGAMLYLQTHEQKYLDDAKKTMDYIVKSMSTPYNTLIANGSAAQSATGDEHGVYNSILAQYAPLLIVDCNQPQYTEIIERSIKLGWMNRNATTLLCNKVFDVKPTDAALSVYTASGIPALMLTFPDVKNRK